MSLDRKATRKHCSERERDNSFKSRVSDSGYMDHPSQSHESVTQPEQQPPIKSDPINAPEPGRDRAPGTCGFITTIYGRTRNHEYNQK